DLEEKTVELRLRQRVSSFKLNRILCGEHGKKFRKVMRNAVNGDLAFFHGFQQGRLCAWRHAVHFVCQKHVSEKRAAVERKSARGKVEYVAPDDVSRHQVRGALHPPKFKIKQAGEALDHQSLGDARYALKQSVPATENRKKALVDQFLLPDNDFSQFISPVLQHSGHVLHEESSPVRVSNSACGGSVPGPVPAQLLHLVRPAPARPQFYAIAPAKRRPCNGGDFAVRPPDHQRNCQFAGPISASRLYESACMALPARRGLPWRDDTSRRASPRIPEARGATFLPPNE